MKPISGISQLSYDNSNYSIDAEALAEEETPFLLNDIESYLNEKLEVLEVELKELSEQADKKIIGPESIALLYQNFEEIDNRFIEIEYLDEVSRKEMISDIRKKIKVLEKEIIHIKNRPVLQ